MNDYIYPDDVVTVRIETWEFECCAPLPVVGGSRGWMETAVVVELAVPGKG
ncbi:hypothetical protein ACFRFQ_22800 [Rhodococcus sp. NPDC056743]|uniref:hypothetical protein n=1 Tax=Rhodococcus sp. NPDC056743 TaxID=3345934 RepID=UPI00366F8F39